MWYFSSGFHCVCSYFITCLVRMGNHATVEYCDCKHFSLLKKKCHNCHKIVCPSCFGYPLVNYDRPAQNPERVSLNKVCKICYTTLNHLDSSKPYEIIGGENSNCLLMIHSEGLSRGMYKKYATGLQEKGFKCILMDLPAHGSLIQEQFTYLWYKQRHHSFTHEWTWFLKVKIIAYY